MDLRCRHENRKAEFKGRAYDVIMAATERHEAGIEAVRRFVELTGERPTQVSWAAAGLRPSERTIRRRFGSFAGAVSAAEVDSR